MGSDKQQAKGRVILYLVGWLVCILVISLAMQGYRRRVILTVTCMAHGLKAPESISGLRASTFLFLRGMDLRIRRIVFTILEKRRRWPLLTLLLCLDDHNIHLMRGSDMGIIKFC